MHHTVLHLAIPVVVFLIAQLVRNMTSRTHDPGLLERVRRQAAHRVLAMQQQERQASLQADGV